MLRCHCSRVCGGAEFCSSKRFRHRSVPRKLSLAAVAHAPEPITSLEVSGDYVIGGTSAEVGLTPYLFAASTSRRQLEIIFPLDEAVTGQRSIPGGFGRGSDGALYAGTIPQSEKGSGHLVRVVVENGRLMVRDIGIPLSGEGVFTVVADPKRHIVYGLTYPSGRFFSFQLMDRKVTLYGETAPDNASLKELSGYVLEPHDWSTLHLESE
jgi:hypothetical protein